MTPRPVFNHEQRLGRVAVLLRFVTLLALSGQMLWDRDVDALMALGLLAVVFASASVAELVRVPLTSRLLLEALGTGAVASYGLRHAVVAVGALIVPPLIAGLRRGSFGVVLSLSVELVTAVGLTLIGDTGLDQAQGGALFIAVMAALGVGLIMVSLTGPNLVERDATAAYREARRLLRGLTRLSSGLESGLDPVIQGAAILTMVRDRIPAARLSLHALGPDGLTHLVTIPDGAEPSSPTVVEQAWTTGSPVLHGQEFGFCVVSDEGPQAVVTGELSGRLSPSDLAIEDVLESLREPLEPAAVELETALMFRDFRDSATAAERQRLAREMHDGVAQEIASMGYMVDALVISAEDDRQHAALTALRHQITGVVAEVRQSVTQLRSETAASESLGAAIGKVARHLSANAGIPITVRADERTLRLKPDVEAQLLRIAQEALNNAIKHARATSIDVTCVVDAPSAALTVRDDGRGLQPGREDSHGLQIMRERAALIGARLEIKDTGNGVAVRVVL